MPIDALSVSCAQLTRDLLAIAKFLFKLHNKTFSLRIFSAHNAKSNTVMLSSKMTSYHKL